LTQKILNLFLSYYLGKSRTKNKIGKTFLEISSFYEMRVYPIYWKW